MKAYEKQVRKIVVDNHTFLFSVIEHPHIVKLRCYSSKTSYIEMLFNWGPLMHDLNLYRPKVVSLLIENAIQQGWDYKNGKQIYNVSVDDSENIVKQLGLDAL